MVVRGHIESSTLIALEEAIEVPEGTKVEIKIHLRHEKPGSPKPFPTFDIPSDSPPITNEMVRRAMDE